MPVQILRTGAIERDEIEFLPCRDTADSDPFVAADLGLIIETALEQFRFGYWAIRSEGRSRWPFLLEHASLEESRRRTEEIAASISRGESSVLPELADLAGRAIDALAAQDVPLDEWSRQLAEDVAHADD